MKEIKISNKTVDNINLTKDYKEAVAQYIWNGFESGADKVIINFDTKDPIGHIKFIEIIDNGSGIPYEELERHFGFLFDSTKKKRRESSDIHGGKGKGRLSFNNVANKATWSTIYEKDKENFKYDISIESSTKNSYRPTKPKKTRDQIGTKVTLEGLNFNLADLKSSDFTNLLSKEFGWYLELKSNKNYKILINGKPLDYKKVIADSESFTKTIDDSDKKKYQFNINYIRWNEKIKEDSFFYLLDSKEDESFKEHTSFNKVAGGAYGFHHSVYVQSDFFDGFISDKETEHQGNLLSKKNLSDPVYKKLKKELKKYLTTKRKKFYQEGADQQISKYEDEGILPTFKEDAFDQERREDFETVFKEIYLIEPLVFQNLQPVQAKSILKMLELLLESNERDSVIEIIDSIVNLDKDERDRFADILSKTKLKNIIFTLKVLEDRLAVVEGLKLLVYDLQKYTNERDHIQKVIESNYWLFGEQYHLVSADIDFQKTLECYLDFILTDPNKTEQNKFSPNIKGSKRRPDIFLCKKRNLPVQNSHDETFEENVIVELKKPSVTIDINVYRQIHDYFRFIRSRPEFNTKLSKWKFFIIGNKLDQDIEDMYESNKQHNIPFLINTFDNYQIYAMTWADVFKNFEMKQKFMLDHLDFDQEALSKHLILEEDKKNKESVDKITTKITK